MGTLYEALLEQLSIVDKAIELPAIQAFTFPPLPVDPNARQNNFAYLSLTDGSVGLTYVALDNALQELHSQHALLPKAGQSAMELAGLYRHSQGWKRALGLAAINAISQHLLSYSASVNAMPDNLQLLSPQTDERIGMVGYFARLVDPLRAKGIPVTVIELEESLLREEPGLEVTLDTSRLAGCSQVIITGTTLLNHSLDNILKHCHEADNVYLLGPSASCLPDALFAAGITHVGGFRVAQPELFKQRWSEAGRWRDAGERYFLTRDNYPGAASLIKTALGANELP
ncbi:Rossmann-like domain-containing protein [Granulosicoccus antarcticus]|uniref:Heavy-metal chelation domain-containing protein n=1 Tax=Granulosicoccus antarcticus IMCC3135 TaxID=1192854 RepID=A0A2Z2NSB5_9GAMM|nr:DUF364 domain-containing protein [Granulosicoccus antarcticus]ASJ74169.1 hypothetical protein IMCC3135_20460 [Granulosicoccus antarcticus IMCC3135]